MLHLRSPRQPVTTMVLVAVALVAGCHLGPHGWLEDYLTRLGRVTGLQVADPRPAVGPVELTDLTFPGRRERTAASSESRIGLVRSIDLRRCGLQDLVAERNGGLGRVMPPSRRLAYEVEFLRRARACGPALEDAGADALAASLAQAADRKTDDLPALVWNATVGSEELAEAFSLTVDPWSRRRPELEERRRELAALRQALNELGSVRRRVWQSLSAEEGASTEGGRDVRERLSAAVEGPVSGLARGAAGGLLRTLLVTGAFLESATGTVSSWGCTVEAEDGGQALSVDRRERAEILARVFEIFYVGDPEDPLQRIGLQEYASILEQESRRLHEVWWSLEEELGPGMPDSFRRSPWAAALDRENGVHRRFRDAVREHAQAWRELFEECGVEPQLGPGGDAMKEW